MQAAEEAIIKILGKTELASPGVDQNVLRGILQEVLYQYDLNTKCTDLALINDIRDKLVMYLSVKKLDGLSNKTIYNYKLHLLRFASCMNKDIVDIDVMDIRMYLANLQQENNIKNTTLSNEISILKSFFSWLVYNDYITKSPMVMVKQPKTEKRLRRSLTQEELERLRYACQTIRQKALLEFIFSTGCRLQEIVDVNVKDINWAERSLKVVGKGDKERVVYFSEKAKLYLKKYQIQIGMPDREPLFVTSKSPFHRLGNRSVEVEVNKIATAAGFDKAVFPHLLRHTMATLGFKQGASLTTIQHLLGHTDPSTTQIYAETDADTVKEEYRKHMVQ